MNGQTQIMDEYKQIQQTRGMWSGFIMDWLKVMVPIGGAFFGLFSYLGQVTVKYLPCSWLLPLLGWLIFTTAILAWRIVVHHIIRQITAMYPRLLELEQRLGWTVHTIYYFNDLSNAGRKLVEERLRIQIGGLTERRNYLQYRDECLRQGKDPYQLLLDVWNDQGYQSVGSRGHAPQDVAVGLISLVTLAIACFLAIGLSPHSTTCIITSGVVATIIVISVILAIVLPRGPWN